MFRRHAVETRAQRIFFALSTVALCAPAQTSATPLFDDDDAMSAVLSVPLQQTYRQKKRDERVYFAGHFAYQGPGGDKIRVPVQVRTRGMFRRLNCRLPPLQLNFKKSTLKGTALAGEDKLKLVGPCTGSSPARQRVLVEELTYRLFQIVAGEAAFDTRRLQLAYIDTDKKYKPTEADTFVIEAEQNLATRLGGKAYKGKRAARADLDPDQVALIEVFQYMIGNTDFSLIAAAPGRDCCHNVKLVRFENGKKTLPVPYDFDSAGIVDAPYAEPADQLPIKTVRTRYFMGNCGERERTIAAAGEIAAKRTDLEAAVTATPGLSERNVKKTLDYLGDFFAIIEDPQQIDRRLLKRCR